MSRLIQTSWIVNLLEAIPEHITGLFVQHRIVARWYKRALLHVISAHLPPALSRVVVAVFGHTFLFSQQPGTSCWMVNDVSERGVFLSVVYTCQTEPLDRLAGLASRVLIIRPTDLQLLSTGDAFVRQAGIVVTTM